MKKYLIILLFFFLPFKIFGQIDAIKGLAEGGIDLLSDLDVEAAYSAISCCWDNGGVFLIGFMIDHHKEIMSLRNLDPTVVSFEARGGFAMGYHYTRSKNYIYVNYLPGLRGNLGVLSTDFRYNILTEYTDDFPNLFTSWEWLFLLNFEPDEKFKLTVGTGIQMEKFTDTYYNEHYIGFKLGFADNRDYLDVDTRFSINYDTGEFPFFEGGIRYNVRVINISNVFVYITLGGVYQNYYSSHDIWAAQGGLTFNIH